MLNFLPSILKPKFYLKICQLLFAPAFCSCSFWSCCSNRCLCFCICRCVSDPSFFSLWCFFCSCPFSSHSCWSCLIDCDSYPSHYHHYYYCSCWYYYLGSSECYYSFHCNIYSSSRYLAVFLYHSTLCTECKSQLDTVSSLSFFYFYWRWIHLLCGSSCVSFLLASVSSCRSLTTRTISTSVVFVMLGSFFLSCSCSICFSFFFFFLLFPRRPKTLEYKLQHHLKLDLALESSWLNCPIGIETAAEEKPTLARCCQSPKLT